MSGYREGSPAEVGETFVLDLDSNDLEAWMDRHEVTP